MCVGRPIKGQPLKSVCFVVWTNGMQDAKRAWADAAAAHRDLNVCGWGVGGGCGMDKRWVGGIKAANPNPDS